MIGGGIGDAGGAQFGGNVRRFHRLAVEVAARAAVEQVRAALDHEVEADAPGRLRDRLAGGRHVDRVEVVVVEIGRRRSGQRHVGDRDAVHRPHRVLRARALRRDVGLLAGLVAADVDAIDEDAGNRAHQRERIARRRNLRELVGRHVGRRAGLLRVDDRRRRGDVHRRRDRADLQRRAEVDGLPRVERDGVPHRRREALERDRHLVRAGRQIEEAVAPLFGRRERLGDVNALERDGAARQHKPRCIDHPAGDRSTGGLRRGARSNQ